MMSVFTDNGLKTNIGGKTDSELIFDLFCHIIEDSNKTPADSVNRAIQSLRKLREFGVVKYVEENEK